MGETCTLVRLLLLLAISISSRVAAQDTTRYTHADTLRGSNGPGRAWWDVQFYDLHVRVNPTDSSIRGWNGITYRVLRPAREMQIDLQPPLEVDSIIQDRRKLTYRRDGNAFFVTTASNQRAGETRTLPGEVVHVRSVRDVDIYGPCLRCATCGSPQGAWAAWVRH